MFSQLVRASGAVRKEYRRARRGSGAGTRLSETQYERDEEIATNFHSTALQVEQWQQFWY